MVGGGKWGVMAGAARRWLDHWQQRVWSLRPMRVTSLLWAYGWQGLARHGLARLLPKRPLRMLVWRVQVQQDLRPESANATELAAEQLTALAPSLRPYKHGIDGLTRQVARGEILAVARLDHGALQGVAFLRPLGTSQWLIHDIFVHPTERRKGLGVQLIQAACALAMERRSGARQTVVWAEVLPYNRASQAMFRQSGWEQVGEILRFGSKVLQVDPPDMGYPLTAGPSVRSNL